MATQNSINLEVTNNADGFDVKGGTTGRKLTVTGADVTLTGSGTNTYTFPATSGTVALVDLIYPIGAIFISTVSTNPGTYLGGTWTAFGAGKTLVGLDSGDTDFDTSEETGGAKTHTLTVPQMPAHTHTGIDYLGTTAGGPSSRLAGSTSGASSGAAAGWTELNNTGGGQAHNNLQPYIVCYFFKRVS